MTEWSQFRMDASQHISRAAGQSAVAAAAYRSGEKLLDERTGEIKDYSRRSGVVSAELVMPDGADVDWTRERLWNQAEAAEKRKDARIARKIELALPAQMTEAQRQALAHAWAEEIANRYGVAVDYAIHLPDQEGDQRNHHVHMMMTTRKISAAGLGKKAALELSNTDQKKWGLPVGNEAIYGLRVALAEVLNREAVRQGLDLHADPRSYAARGIDLTPTKHVGVHAVHMHRRGIASERVAAHEKIKAENARRIMARPELILDKLTRTEAVFSRHDVARELHRYMDDPNTYQTVLARLESSAELVVLVEGEAGKAVQYSTREMILAEERMIKAAETLARTYSHPVASPYQQQIMARYSHLSVEQLTERGNLAVVAGAAGTGKSAALQAAREIWEAQGYSVRGAALAGKAAEALHTSSGIESRTLHSLEYAWRKGYEPLSARDVLVIDEAGMIGSRQLSRVLEATQEAGAKVVLIGDARQLQPIEAGAAFRAIAEQVGMAEIHAVRRQREAWAQRASQAFARGDVKQGLAAYAQRGHVQFLENRQAAKLEIARDWQANRHREGACLILAHTNQDVLDLNQAVRAERHCAGELGKDAAFTTARGERPFASGDRLVFLQNDRALGVKNGTLATVLEADKGCLVARLDSGKTVTVDQARYASIDHGYAVTLHKAQGVTVDRAYLLASSGMDRHLTYVGMTRHRESVTLYAGQDDFKHAGELAGRLNRARPKRSTLDFAQRRGLETPQVWPERGQEAQSPPPDRSIMARLDGFDRTKAALSPDLLRRMEQGMADFERRFEMRQKIEQGMARFEQRFAQWEARQAQAERERQPAQELEWQREKDARPPPTRTLSRARSGPEFSR